MKKYAPPFYVIAFVAFNLIYFWVLTCTLGYQAALKQEGFLLLELAGLGLMAWTIFKLEIHYDKWKNS